MKRLLLIPLLFTATSAFAACELEIAVGDNLQFDKTEMQVERSCGTVTLTLTHTGSLNKQVMGHNWVLSKEADVNAIATEGMAAGADNNYITPGDARVFAHTPIIGGGEQTTIEFSLEGLPDSEYTYFCSFLGHSSVMKGVLRII